MNRTAIFVAAVLIALSTAKVYAQPFSLPIRGCGVTQICGGESPASAIAAIQQRNDAVQRAIGQGVDQLRNIFENRQRERAARESDRLDKRLRPSESGSFSSSSYPAVSDTFDCVAAMSVYHSGNGAPSSPCASDLDPFSTYQSSGGTFGFSPDQEETVIDGSDIPCVIDFSGLNPFPDCAPQGAPSAIPSQIDFPGASSDASDSFDPFNQVHERYQKLQKQGRIGRR